MTLTAFDRHMHNIEYFFHNRSLFQFSDLQIRSMREFLRKPYEFKEVRKFANELANVQRRPIYANELLLDDEDDLGTWEDELAMLNGMYD